MSKEEIEHLEKLKELAKAKGLPTSKIEQAIREKQSELREIRTEIHKEKIKRAKDMNLVFDFCLRHLTESKEPFMYLRVERLPDNTLEYSFYGFELEKSWIEFFDLLSRYLKNLCNQKITIEFEREQDSHKWKSAVIKVE